MAALGSHGNVYNTCLLIMRERGYTLSLRDVDDNVNLWVAEKNGYDFVADNPIELLGLVSIYEYQNPIGPPNPYWWAIDGPDIFFELTTSDE